MADYSVTKTGSQFNLDQQWHTPGIVGNSVTKIFIQFFSAILIAVGISACSLSGPNVVSLDSGASPVTSSVAEPTKIAGIEKTDTEVIKSAVAKATLKSRPSMALAWVNPETGSSGTITTIDRFFGNRGQKCRGFTTTVSTFMGIAFYNGEACQITPSEWVLSWLKPLESKSWTKITPQVRPTAE